MKNNNQHSLDFGDITSKLDKINVNKGLLITFEGGEGSGKSTQCKRLVKKLVDEGINSILIHEPGNTMLGEQVRKWVKSKNIQNPLAETYLFCAARAELCKSVIGPALDKGVTVIVDRFIHSTLAYQGYGKGVDLEIINNLNKITIEDYKPDLGYAVRVDKFADSSIDMYIRCFTKTDDWDEWLAVKERLAISIKQIVEKNKASFAFPSQSIYVEKK